MSGRLPTSSYPHEQWPQPDVDWGFEFRKFRRQDEFRERTPTLSNMPGALGAREVLFESSHDQTGKRSSTISVVLVGREYWQG